MPPIWKNRLFYAAIAAGGILATEALLATHFAQLLSLKAQDIEFVARGKRPVKDIVLVVIDEKSLNTFPELLAFWHPYYAEAIHAAEAGQAKVLAFDIAFGIPVSKWAPNNDQILAEAVSSAQIPTIVAYIPALLGKQAEWPVPVNMIAGALGLAAFSNLTVDPDDFVRNQEVFEAPPGDKGDQPLARSFGLRVAEKFLGTDALFDQGKLTLQGRPIPLSRDRTIAINFAGPADSFPRVSLSDFLAAYKKGNVAQLKSWVGGKAVLIGPDSIDDRYPTPFYSSFDSSKWTTAGVEIHANTLANLLHADYLLPAPGWARDAVLLAVASLTIWGASLPIGYAALTLAGILLAIGVWTQGAFRTSFIFPPFELFLCWLICLLATAVLRFSMAETRRDLFRRAVSLFVGKKVASSLDHAGSIMLTGSRQNVTILFTDIRGFTAYCEEKNPAVVVESLNEYMRTMVAIVVKYRGHVNKFIGDGILAVFSDEDESTAGDYALRAVQCATEMVSVPGHFETGAGLHTGPVVVGNIGSQDKMEYTVLGNTVNLASRLESLNKETKTRLLMSRETRDLLQSDLETVLLGAVSVRGKSIPMDLYTVASLVPPPVPAPVNAAGTSKA